MATRDADTAAAALREEVIRTGADTGHPPLPIQQLLLTKSASLQVALFRRSDTLLCFVSIVSLV